MTATPIKAISAPIRSDYSGGIPSMRQPHRTGKTINTPAIGGKNAPESGRLKRRNNPVEHKDHGAEQPIADRPATPQPQANEGTTTNFK